ncbi:MAG: protein kinase domain-containing protein, partial [Prochlorothrix sp.]
MPQGYHSGDLSGTVLRQRYRIQHPLGEGGFAYTYQAVDLDRPGQPPCVIKRLKPQADRSSTEQAQRLFTQEAETLAQLYQRDQPNRIPELLAYFEEKGEFFLVQEWIEGHTLDQEILPNQLWPEAVVLSLMQDVLEALIVLHQNQVIHRDLKPSNIMRRQRDGRIFVIDFGAVKQDSGTGFTVAIGTAGYMPLEQLYGTPKLASDLYALGAIALQALTGKLPTELWDSDRQQLIWRDRVRIQPEFADWLDRMVAPQLQTRYGQAMEALAALPRNTGSAAAFGDSVLIPPPIPAVSRPGSPPPPTRATVIAGGAAVAPTSAASATAPGGAGVASGNTGLTALLHDQRKFPWGPVLGLGAVVLALIAWAIVRNQNASRPVVSNSEPVAQASPSLSPAPVASPSPSPSPSPPPPPTPPPVA